MQSNSRAGKHGEVVTFCSLQTEHCNLDVLSPFHLDLLSTNMLPMLSNEITYALP